MESPASDPSPISYAPPANYAVQSNLTSPPPFSTLVNLPQPQVFNHPSYEEMITRAIMALNEKDGSSRQKIAKFIENEFHVPPTMAHNSELTNHLRQMKAYGKLVLVRHSYMLPVAPTPQFQPQPPMQPYVAPPAQPSVGSTSAQPSVGPPVQPSIVPFVQASASPNYAVSVVPKRRPGRPPKLQPILGTGVVSPAPTPSPSPPVGFAAFSPKPLGVPTTNLFGRLTPPAHQFGAGPVNSVSTMGLVTGPVYNASTVVPVPANGVPTLTLASGPVTNVPSTGLVNNVPSIGPGLVNDVPSMGLVSGNVTNVSPTGPASAPTNNVLALGLFSNSVSNVSSISPASGTASYSVPVFDPVALAKGGPNHEQIDELAGVESKVDSVMVGTGLESSAGPLVVSAAQDPSAAQNNVEPLLVVSASPNLVAQNNDGPSTVLGKRGRGRPPKINGPLKTNGPPKTLRGKIVRKGRRGRPRKVYIPISTISLRPRGRPRKNAGGAVVAVDEANGGGVNGGSGGAVFPAAQISMELRDRSMGCPNKDLPDTSRLTSEMQLMAYQGLKAHYQTRIKSAVSVIRPYVNETAVIALRALQDLEDLTNMDITSAPAYAQSAPAYAQSAPAYVRSEPVDDLNPIVNVQGARVDDLNVPVNVEDAANGNMQSVPSTAEDAQLTFQGTPSDAETAQLTSQIATLPVQGQQEPHLQS